VHKHIFKIKWHNFKVIQGIKNASCPSEIACLSLVSNVSLFLYSGRLSVLEQVLAVGRLSNPVEQQYVLVISQNKYGIPCYYRMRSSCGQVLIRIPYKWMGCVNNCDMATSDLPDVYTQRLRELILGKSRVHKIQLICITSAAQACTKRPW